MNHLDAPTTDPAVDDNFATPRPTAAEGFDATASPLPTLPVNPVRAAAAGRLGGYRVHRLAELGREYEREHGLAAGRQRLKQLIQLGKRYEQEHGLAAPKPRRKPKGDVWAEFVAALGHVVQPKYRPAVERLVATLRPAPAPAAGEPVAAQVGRSATAMTQSLIPAA